jgi:hypothetical protein
MYYALAVLSVGGLVLLRRRRIPIFPLLAVVLDVVVSVALTFGQTRYRTTAEVALVLASSVLLEWAWGRLARGRGRHRAEPRAPSDDPTPRVDRPARADEHSPTVVLSPTDGPGVQRSGGTSR